MASDKVTPEMFDGIVDIILKNGRASETAEEIAAFINGFAGKDSLLAEKASLEELIEQGSKNSHYAPTPEIRAQENVKLKALRRALESVEADIARRDAAPAPAAPKPRKLKAISIIREDEELTILYGKKEIGHANHDEHGWSGMGALEDLARDLAKAMKLEIKEN